MTGELDPGTLSAFEEHLALCPDCVAFLNTYTKTVQVTRSLHYESIPPQLRKRVREFVHQRIKKGRRGR
jgi:anti-sigma factor RsiW